MNYAKRKRKNMMKRKYEVELKSGKLQKYEI